MTTLCSLLTTIVHEFRDAGKLDILEEVGHVFVSWARYDANVEQERMRISW